MEIIFVLLIGAVAGFAAHYALPARATRGALLLAGYGIAAGLLTWTALDLAGVGTGPNWASTVIAALVIPVVAGLVHTQRRTAADNAARTAARI